MRFSLTTGVAFKIGLFFLSLCPAAWPDDLDAALQRAAARGTAQDVTRLLQKGADINARDTSGVTPLMNAATLDRPEIVDFLLQKRAAVKIRDFSGFSVVSCGLDRNLLPKFVARGQRPMIAPRFRIGSKTQFGLIPIGKTARSKPKSSFFCKLEWT